MAAAAVVLFVAHASCWCYCCQPLPWWPACMTDTMCRPCLPGRRGKGGRGRGRGRGKGAPKAAEWDYYPQASQQSKKQQQRVVSYKEDSDLSLSDDAGGRVGGLWSSFVWDVGVLARACGCIHSAHVGRRGGSGIEALVRKEDLWAELGCFLSASHRAGRSTSIPHSREQHQHPTEQGAAPAEALPHPTPPLCAGSPVPAAVGPTSRAVPARARRQHAAHFLRLLDNRGSWEWPPAPGALPPFAPPPAAVWDALSQQAPELAEVACEAANAASSERYFQVWPGLGLWGDGWARQGGLDCELGKGGLAGPLTKWPGATGSWQSRLRTPTSCYGPCITDRMPPLCVGRPGGRRGGGPAGPAGTDAELSRRAGGRPRHADLGREAARWAGAGGSSGRRSAGSAGRHARGPGGTAAPGRWRPAGQWQRVCRHGAQRSGRSGRPWPAGLPAPGA